MLCDGRVQEFPNGRYRIVFDETPGANGTLVFGPLIDELGKECIVDRPTAMAAIDKAHAVGFRAVVCGYSNRHPLYRNADEYWGICVPMRKNSDWHSWYRPEIQKALPRCKFANSDGAEYPGFFVPGVRKHSPLPMPSRRAVEKATEIAAKRPLVTICPRNVAHPPRDFKAWQDVVDGILGFGADVVSCTPLDASYRPSGAKFLQDMVGLNDLLDVELALHGMADCCVASNTGAMGLMIYARAKAIVNVGGTGSYAPGWEGLRDAVARENGTKPTKIFVTEGLGREAMYGFNVPMEKHREMAKLMVGHIDDVLHGAR
jgi:hypothetical protein